MTVVAIKHSKDCVIVLNPERTFEFKIKIKLSYDESTFQVNTG